MRYIQGIMNSFTVDYFIHKGSNWNRNFKPDLSRCRFSVTEHGRVTDWHQCTRKSVENVEGYDFCKQHANEVKSRLGIRTDATKIKYAASFSYGNPNIIELEILLETDSMIEVSGYKSVMGDSTYGIYQGRLKKNSQYTREYEFFDSFDDAIGWMLNQGDKYVQSCEKNLEDAKNTYQNLLEKWTRIK